jgi:hypothetical protein
MFESKFAPLSRLSHWPSALFLSLALAGLFSLGSVNASTKVDDHFVVVRESRPLVAREGVWQTYTDHLHVKAGQEKKQWILSFTNGAEGRPKLTDLRITLAGKPLATIKDFDATGSLSRSLNDLVKPGTNALVSEVFGPSGSRLSWKILSEKPTITSIDPNPFAREGNLTIRGTKFSAVPHAVKVAIGGRPAELVSASETELVVKIPAGTAAGDQKVVVSVDSAKSNAFTVKGRPNIYWIDITSQSPSQPVMILGRGFSKVPAENVVMVGPHKARVTAASATNITFIVPEMHFPQHGLPLTVITNGVSSTDHLILDVDMRVIPNMIEAPKIVR